MKTRYTVDVSPTSSLTFAIGNSSPELDQLLHQFHSDTFAYLTAYNPQSTSLSPAENQQRHERLCRDIQQRGFTFLIGKAIPDTGDWEPEVCVFAFNMSRSKVRELCQAYAQDGAVVGERGSTPKLLFTNPVLREDFLMLMHNCVLD
jgi:phosphoenolpyruvate-protein kinase (PTS system EI component)